VIRAQSSRIPTSRASPVRNYPPNPRTVLAFAFGSHPDASSPLPDARTIETPVRRSTLVRSPPSHHPSSPVLVYSRSPFRRSAASRSTSLVTHLWACTGPATRPRRRVYARENSFKPIRNFNRVNVCAPFSRRSLGVRACVRITTSSIGSIFRFERAREASTARGRVPLRRVSRRLFASVPLTAPRRATRPRRRRGRTAGVDA
jgi:hypothetical protein